MKQASVNLEVNLDKWKTGVVEAANIIKKNLGDNVFKPLGNSIKKTAKTMKDAFLSATGFIAKNLLSLKALLIAILSGEAIKKLFEVFKKSVTYVNDLQKKIRGLNTLLSARGFGAGYLNNQVKSLYKDIGYSKEQSLDAAKLISQAGMGPKVTKNALLVAGVIGKQFNEDINNVVNDIVEALNKNEIENMSKYGINTSAINKLPEGQRGVAAYQQLATMAQKIDPSTLMTKFDKVIRIFEDLKDTFYNLMANIVLKAKDKIETFVGHLIDVLNVLINNMDLIFPALGEISNYLLKFVSGDKSVWNGLINALKTLWNEIISTINFENILKSAYNVTMQSSIGLKAANELGNKIAGTNFEGFEDAFNLKSLSTSTKSTENLKKLVKEITNGFKNPSYMPNTEQSRFYYDAESGELRERVEEKIDTVVDYVKETSKNAEEIAENMAKQREKTQSLFLEIKEIMKRKDKVAIHIREQRPSYYRTARVH